MIEPNKQNQKHFGFDPGPCQHKTVIHVPAPGTMHHAKILCDDCGCFLGWQPKPETIARLSENKRRLEVLLTLDTVGDWERKFLESVAAQERLSPKQQTKLDEVWCRHVHPA